MPVPVELKTMFKMTTAKLRGFSLLEMMLVIAIMAVISVAGLSYLRERVVNAKINKTALQMQQWLQAAIAYHNDTKKWPENVNSLLPDAQDPTKAYYMPADSQYSPWYISGTETGLYSFRLTKETARQARLLLKLPDKIGDINGIEIAKRIAGKLPVTESVTESKVIAVTVDSAGPGLGTMSVIKIIPGQFRKGVAYVRSEAGESEPFNLLWSSYMEQIKGANLCNRPNIIKRYVQLTGFDVPRVRIVKTYEAGKLDTVSIKQPEESLDITLQVKLDKNKEAEIDPESENNGYFMATLTCEAPTQ
jgi:prepilin-type N-terminal cleavage/methylation domain-containing protein